MITNDQFIQMLELLLKKSRANQVRWVQGEQTNASSSYHVRFRDGSRLEIEYRSPTSSSDVTSAVLASNGSVLMEYEVEDGEPNFELLSQLHDEAYRHVTKWDTKLESIMSELEGSEIVGEDDSVPF